MKESNTISDNVILKEFLNSDNFYQFSWGNENDYYCSDSFLEKTKLTFDEINKLPFKHFSLVENNVEVDTEYEESTSEELFNALNQLFQEKNDKKLEFIYKIKSNEEEVFWVKEIVTIILDNDGSKKINCLAFDVTDIKQKEIELNKIITEKIRLNKAKDKLISIISHDLRSPFSSLLGFTEILLNEPDLPAEERIEFIKYIHDASKIQLEMVNHLLDWTHLQNGTMKFNPQKLDISNIAISCISVLTGVSMRKSIEVKFEGEINQFVIADERLITQVITNLLSNALKFTPADKNITVSIVSFNNDVVEIIIKDEGVGISERDQVKMFNIDTKFTKTGTAGEKGSGLGLTLVKEIVEKHKGEIWFYSKINEGSEFHFTLPKAGQTILIVEDDLEKQDSLSNVLNEKLPNFNVVFTENGLEALTLILDKTPSIVIANHNMSLMNGTQLVSALRDINTHKNIPVVIITDELTEKIESEYKPFGRTHFVKSSSDIAELTYKLVEVLS